MASPAAKTATPGRKAFVRSQVPGWERAASVVILVLLVAVGAIIWIKGKHYDPSKYALRPEALAGTAVEVEGKSGTLRATGEGRPVGTKTISVAATLAAPEMATGSTGESYEAAAPASALPEHIRKREPLVMTVAGIKPMGDTEFYSADNLYEKIDGRAPAYIGFNVQGLRSRSFEVMGASGSFADVYEYYFDTPIDAFGMFALERDANSKPVDFAPDGYAGEMGFFFRQGVCYVQVIASDTNAATLQVAKAVALDRAKALPADNTGLDARRRLPSKGLDSSSVKFEAENALGQEFLKNVFQASYDFGGKPLSFFLMITTPDEAAAAWKSFEDFGGKFGGKVTSLPDVEGAKIFQADSFGTCKIIYQRGGELGGVVDAEDAGRAREFVEQYLQNKLK